MHRSLMPCISPGTEMACYNNKSTHLTGPFLHRGQLSPRVYEEKCWPLYNLFLFLLPYNVEKENKVDCIFGQLLLYNVSCKTLWILILALPLHALNIFFFFCIQQSWQLHSLRCHRHSHQAWLQIKSQCLTIFPQISGTSFILLFCSLQVSIIFVFLCLYILQLSLRWPWIWSALWVSWPQISISGKELAHARVAV